MTATLDGEVAELRLANAELQLAECNEALKRKNPAAEVLQVINSSTGGLTPVFDAMLEKAMRLCDAAHGHFSIYDGERFHPAALRGEPRLAEFLRQQGPFPPHETNPLTRLIRGERVIHVADARARDAYRHVPAYRSVIDLGRIHTSLTVPLRKEGALLGAVKSHRQEVRRFSDKQIALVESRRPCGHRNGERAAVGRNARDPRTADRHCRSAGGYQFFAR